MAHALKQDMLPAVRYVVSKNAIRDSAGSLVLWGMINLIGWAQFGQQARRMLRGMQNPGFGPYLFTYGTLMLAIGMILFGLYGLLSSHVVTILFNAITLTCSGGWAILQHYLKALVPGNQFVLDPVVVFYSLGIGLLQLMWAFREAARYHQYAAWHQQSWSAEHLDEIGFLLGSFVKLPASFTSRRIKAGRVRALLPDTACTGQLCQSMVILVSDRLNDVIAIPLRAARQGRFSANGTWSVSVEDKPLQLRFSGESLAAIKQWVREPVTPADMPRILSDPGGPAQPLLLEIFHGTDDAYVRAQTLRAMRYRWCEDFQHIAVQSLRDRHPRVRAAALELCRIYRVRTAGEDALRLIKDADPEVRRRAAEYLQRYPRRDAAPTLDLAILSEPVNRTRRALKRAWRRCDRLARRVQRSGDPLDMHITNP